MSAAKDLLGRPPVMRPIPPREREDWTSFRREQRDGKFVSHVPYASTNSSAPLTAPVTVAPAPWEVGQ